jgi:hypothetical protein
MSRPHTTSWDLLGRHAEHNNRALDDVWDESRLSDAELARDRLVG